MGGIDLTSQSTPRARFYLGTHQPHWLERVDIPLFVSHRQLARRPRRRQLAARCRWALDSGGFTELALHGRWITPPTVYAEAVATYAETIGGLDFAAPQDWMCEPVMLERTGLSVAEHQERTVANYLLLRQIAPGLPFIPILQGWHLTDYLSCIDLYASAGVRLADLPRVGLGSICRRQSTAEIAFIVAILAGRGLRLHGFGVKTGGLNQYGKHLASADSLAWSYAARRQPPLTGHPHKNCANCLPYALAWRERVLAHLDAATHQQDLFDLLAEGQAA
ncbi:DUF7221 family queuine tRNA-ribosyltransferase-like protein [Nonomuraea typhae]|uniref:deazapurine DNA modification protein DpdA family protein n=1 Tax=Nonomuraea typhae TaxID=2603600 RepID=UPI0012FC9989|nr:hypothetical protein [Nonomuraea typhae]